MFFNPLLLGVAAAIDPVLIGSVAFMLTRRNPKRLLAVYLVGGFGISMIAGVVVLFVLKDVGANKHSSAPPEIEIAVGALLVVAAVLIGTGLSARLRERVQARRETHHGGGLAGILVYENVWAVPMWTAIDRSAARLVGAGRIGADDLIAALDSPDPA